MELSIQIAKFKFHQYELRAVSPNLMLAKVTRYTVYIWTYLKNAVGHYNIMLYENIITQRSLTARTSMCSSPQYGTAPTACITTKRKGNF